MEQSHFLHYLEQTACCDDIQSLTDQLHETAMNFVNTPLLAIYTQTCSDRYRITISPRIPDLFLYQHPRHFLGTKTIHKGKPLFQMIDDYSNPEVACQLREFGCQSLLSLPLTNAEGTPVAALSIFLRDAEKPCEDAMNAILQLCSYVSLQLQRIFRYQKVVKELDDQQRNQTDMEILFRESMELICMLDDRGNFRHINPALQKTLQYPLEELADRHICDFVHVDDRSYLSYMLHFIKEHPCIQGYSHRYMNMSGEEVLVEFSAQYLPDSKLIIATARNLTGQRAMERQTANLERSVVMERMKTDFFAGVSHGLKTPLNVIQSSADLMRLKLMREDPDTYYREYEKFFGYTKQNCFRLLRLIGNLLDYAKLEVNDLHLTLAPCQIGDFIWDTVEMVQEYADVIGCTLSLQGSLVQPSEYCLDSDNVERILLNLLSNSLKYCSKGGHIDVDLSEDDTHLIIQVSDNGKGIPEVMVPMIFNRSHTSNRTLIKTVDGAGLGLKLCKALVQLHGGTIQVKIGQQIGTSIIFTLSKFLMPSPNHIRTETDTLTEADYIATPYIRQSRVQVEMSDLPVMPFLD